MRLSTIINGENNNESVHAVAQCNIRPDGPIRAVTLAFITELMKHPTRDNLQILRQITVLESDSRISRADVNRLEKAISLYIDDKNNCYAKDNMNKISEELLSKIKTQ